MQEERRFQLLRDWINRLRDANGRCQPAFEVHGAPPRMLRRLYRALPRSALFDGGRVIVTWTGFPSDAALDTLARGDLP